MAIEQKPKLTAKEVEARFQKFTKDFNASVGKDLSKELKERLKGIHQEPRPSFSRSKLSMAVQGALRTHADKAMENQDTTDADDQIYFAIITDEFRYFHSLAMRAMTTVPDMEDAIKHRSVLLEQNLKYLLALHLNYNPQFGTLAGIDIWRPLSEEKEAELADAMSNPDYEGRYMGIKAIGAFRRAWIGKSNSFVKLAWSMSGNVIATLAQLKEDGATDDEYDNQLAILGYLMLLSTVENFQLEGICGVMNEKQAAGEYQDTNKYEVFREYLETNLIKEDYLFLFGRYYEENWKGVETYDFSSGLGDKLLKFDDQAEEALVDAELDNAFAAKATESVALGEPKDA